MISNEVQSSITKLDILVRDVIGDSYSEVALDAFLYHKALTAIDGTSFTHASLFRVRAEELHRSLARRLHGKFDKYMDIIDRFTNAAYVYTNYEFNTSHGHSNWYFIVGKEFNEVMQMIPELEAILKHERDNGLYQN